MPPLVMIKKSKTVLKRWRSKYRLVVLNDETFEEKISLKLSRLNVFLVITIAAILLVGSTILFIAFTPIKEYIPGYASTDLRRKAFQLSVRADSLEKHQAYNNWYIENIRNVLNGEPMVSMESVDVDTTPVIGDMNPAPSSADSNLRDYVEEEDRFNISNSPDQNLARFSFMAPVTGLVTSSFDPGQKHYGIDVTARKNTPIKSCLAGTVIFAEWTTETGYVMIVQHNKELISIYRHCSALLKKPGDLVQTGQAIGIIGNSGENSTGPHLHFELWHQGNPVNPENFISF